MIIWLKPDAKSIYVIQPELAICEWMVVMSPKPPLLTTNRSFSIRKSTQTRTVPSFFLTGTKQAAQGQVDRWIIPASTIFCTSAWIMAVSSGEYRRCLA